MTALSDLSLTHFEMVSVATYVQDLFVVCFHVVQLVLEVIYGGVLLLLHPLTLSLLSP